MNNKDNSEYTVYDGNSFSRKLLNTTEVETYIKRRIHDGGFDEDNVIIYKLVKIGSISVKINLNI